MAEHWPSKLKVKGSSPLKCNSSGSSMVEHWTENPCVSGSIPLQNIVL